jgi:AcrR family transcriptional regulator
LGTLEGVSIDDAGQAGAGAGTGGGAGARTGGGAGAGTGGGAGAGTGQGCGAGTPRPLRRDAEQNRRRILRAASEVLAERGLDATLDDVARKAGVGVGTVYRRFPRKEALIGALFDEQLSSLVAIGERALAEPDPWTGLVGYLEAAADLLTADRALRQILMFTSFSSDQAARARAQLQPLVTRLVGRAQEAGAVRADLRVTDVPFIVFMLAAAADYARPVRPATWRRYLALLVDSLPPARASTMALPEPPLSPAEMQSAMQCGPVYLR